MRLEHGRWPLRGILLVAVLAATGVSDSAAYTENETFLLDEANRRWQGARCSTRLPIEIRKNRERDGWTTLQWFTGEQIGDVQARVRVSDAAAVRRHFGRVVPPGTELLAVGWNFEAGGDKVYLELGMQELPVRVLVHFSIDHGFGFAGIGKLGRLEQWVRFEFLEVLSAADEVLVDVPGSAAAPAAGFATPDAVSPSNRSAAAAAASSRDESAMLAAANERWAGAACRSRWDFPIKKGTEGKGGAKSPWLPRSTGPLIIGGRELALRIFFSDGDAIRREFGSGIVPAGTEFACLGWQAEKGGRIFLELKEKRTGVDVKVHSGYGLLSLKAARFPDFEFWARRELFAVAVADEVLVEIPASMPAAGTVSAGSPVAPVAEPGGAPAPATQPVEAGLSVALRVLGVAVEPLRVSAGGEVVLIVTYSVSGGTGASTIAVVERRTIRQQGSPLTTLEATVSRTPGTHESRQTLQIPGDLAAGVYELRASVEAGDSAAQGSAIFQVTVP